MKKLQQLDQPSRLGRNPLKTAFKALCLVGLCAASAQEALATPIVWQTPTGSSTVDGAVSAKATFDLSTTGHIIVTLTNLLQNPKSDGQLNSGLTFSVSNVTGAATTVNTGNISTLSNGGSYTAGVTDALTRWAVSQPAANTIHLTTLTGGQPNRLIIGPDSDGDFNPNTGSYSNANPSVINHTPSVLGTATFDITVPGVLTASQIANVIFQFGTDEGSRLVTACNAADTSCGGGGGGGSGGEVPEPATFLLLAAGLPTLRAFRKQPL